MKKKKNQMKLSCIWHNVAHTVHHTLFQQKSKYIIQNVQQLFLTFSVIISIEVLIYFQFSSFKFVGSSLTLNSITFCECVTICRLWCVVHILLHTAYKFAIDRHVPFPVLPNTYSTYVIVGEREKSKSSSNDYT